MEAKHPPQANPNRGYSFVGQENVANISGYEKGLGPGKTRDIKVRYRNTRLFLLILIFSGNARYGKCSG